MILYALQNPKAPYFYVFMSRNRQMKRALVHVYHPTGAIQVEFYETMKQAGDDIEALKWNGYFDMMPVLGILPRLYMLAHPGVVIPFPSVYIKLLYPNRFVPDPPLWQRTP